LGKNNLLFPPVSLLGKRKRHNEAFLHPEDHEERHNEAFLHPEDHGREA